MSEGEKEPVGKALGAVGRALSVEGPGVEDMLSGVWDENQRVDIDGLICYSEQWRSIKLMAYVTKHEDR